MLSCCSKILNRIILKLKIWGYKRNFSIFAQKWGHNRASTKLQWSWSIMRSSLKSTKNWQMSWELRRNLLVTQVSKNYGWKTRCIKSNCFGCATCLRRIQFKSNNWKKKTMSGDCKLWSVVKIFYKRNRQFLILTYHRQLLLAPMNTKTTVQ